MNSKVEKPKTKENEEKYKPFYRELLKGETKKFIPQKTKQVKTCILTITPLEAKHILKHYNKTNRPPSRAVVKKYAADMKNGEWKFSGQTIQFDEKGNIIDGQHRLLGIVESNLPQQFIVVYGVSNEAFTVIDNGKGRSIVDVVGMKGHKNAALLSSLCRSIIAFTKSGEADTDNRKFRVAGLHEITNADVLNYIEANSNVKNYLEKYSKNNLIAPSIAAFAYWILCKHDKNKAEEYLNKVLLGFDLKPDTIEAYVYNKLQRNRNAQQNKMIKNAVLANIIEGYRRFTGLSKTKAIQINWDATKGIPRLP